MDKFSHEVLEIAERIKPLLAGKPPAVQGAVLAELLSIYLAGHVVVGSPAKTFELRAELLAEICRLVRQLTELNAEASGNS